MSGQTIELKVDGLPPQRTVTLTVDGQSVSVPEGSTLLDACRALEIDTPTLCCGETLTPANACRVCMVELVGARTLVPSCSRKAEDGMEVKTDSERVRLNRRMVLEMLASSVDLSTTPGFEVYLERYEAKPERYGPPAPADSERDRRRAGHHTIPDGQTAATVAGPAQGRQRALHARLLQVRALLQVRRRLRRPAPEHVRDHRGRTRIRRPRVHRVRRELPDSACVYCGNCIAVCPTGALMPVAEYELRESGDWDESRQTHTDTICAFCGVGCTLSCRAGRPDRQGQLARRPRRDPRQSVHQGALRLRARASARARSRRQRPLRELTLAARR